MALPLVVPAGITAARVAAPYLASLVRTYGPKVLGALTGASVGDKFIDIGQLEKDKDIGKLPASVKTETEEDFKIPPFMGVIPSVVDLIEGFSQADSKPKEKGFVQEDIPDMSMLTKTEDKTIDDLLSSGQIKKASEITDDAENLMAIKRDRLQKIIEAKRPGGKIFEIGEEGTEGTFRYRGETYDKADGVLIGYPSKRAGRDFEKNWVPKKVMKEPNVEAMKEGAKAGLEGKRLKNIDQYATLKDNMLKNNLTFEEAVVEAAGKELKRSTKNYQIVGKFYRIADEMKKVNPELHAFFENQVKAYQIGNEVGGKFKKVRFGTKEYEEARIKLAEKLNIDVKNIDRAHSIMQSRLTKLSKLVEDGVITSEQYNRLAKPQYFLLNADNLKHVGLENKLDELLQRKKKFLDEGDTKSANRVQRGDIIELEDGTKRIIEGIDDIAKKMEELGVESELFDPIKKLIKVFGRRPDAVELYKKAVETGVKKREGGMMSIFDIIQPIRSKYIS